MAVKDLLTADTNYVADVPSPGQSDMQGSGEQKLVEHGAGSASLSAFDDAVALKSGVAPTARKMGVPGFANTPRGGATEIGLSQALNVTGSKKAG